VFDEGVAVFRGHFDHRASGGSGEERQVGADFDSGHQGEGHFRQGDGQGDGQAALAHVMGAQDESAIHPQVAGEVEGAIFGAIGERHQVAGAPEHAGGDAAAERRVDA
jgi:hypothetical protein